ncbi:unnamed protein product [Rotaria sordida]|uniref:Uncharacterized protein n=1 Tax=Rotaria sordida TaxID=392033 RepID=A0A814UIT8_9BILA|nr:unnamed protein product [Rotaria sordida]
MGQVIVKKKDVNDASARGNGEYTSDQHRFLFKIEGCDTSRWMFICIISKHVPIVPKSCNSRSSYGCGGGACVHVDGLKQSEFNGYRCDIEKNDILQLFIDCDEEIIRLKNERTRKEFELKVDTSKCQFSWQVNVHLYWTNDRVRILQM